MWKLLALLGTLYFSQGLPYGFFVQALPTLMRKQGQSLEAIGVSSLLMVPWALKFVVAPWVDKFGGSALGRRRGWILPLQLASVLSILGLAVLGHSFPSGGSNASLVLMAVAVVITAALSATQDCATDGLAVSILSERARGLGNGVQVAAYRVGMAVGGGALLWVHARAGWFPTFFSMAALLALFSVPMLLWKEPPTPVHDNSSNTTAYGSSSSNTNTITNSTRAFFRRPGAVVWLLLLCAYKFGDALGSTMVKPMLVDAGLSLERIGLVAGSLGSVVAIFGAVLGGWMAGAWGRKPTLLLAGLVHALLMGLYALCAPGGLASVEVLQAVLVLEHFTGSMATVALFTVMMDSSNAHSGATDYTLQATVVVAVTAVGNVLSGFVAQALGYSAFFVLAGVLCAVGTVTFHRAARMVKLSRVGFAGQLRKQGE